MFIPQVNVDGSKYIEDMYIKTGKLEAKRKNMHISDHSCDATHAGVDLNRNYGYRWGETEDTHAKKEKTNECSTESFMGVKPFSEPET